MGCFEVNRMNTTDKVEFVKTFVEVFKESDEMQQMVLDLIVGCPNVRTEI